MSQNETVIINGKRHSPHGIWFIPSRHRHQRGRFVCVQKMYGTEGSRSVHGRSGFRPGDDRGAVQLAATIRCDHRTAVVTSQLLTKLYQKLVKSPMSITEFVAEFLEPECDKRPR